MRSLIEQLPEETMGKVPSEIPPKPEILDQLEPADLSECRDQSEKRGCIKDWIEEK